MENKFTKSKKLEAEHVHLLGLAPQGEERIKLFQSKGVRGLENIEEYNISLEKENRDLKKELSSEGIDVDSYLYSMR